MANPQTYHCLCTTFILATNHDLESLPVRADPARDQAKILPMNAADGCQHVVLQNIVSDRKAVIIRREDGFEKRRLVRCSRCNLVVGYKLDEAQFKDGQANAENVLYILRGAFTSTEDMKVGEMPTVLEGEQHKT